MDAADVGDALLLTAPDHMAAVMSRAGVGDGTSAVLYDDTLSYFASRVWWSLRAYGYESARILEAGFPAWIEAGQHRRQRGGAGRRRRPSRRARRCASG